MSSSAASAASSAERPPALRTVHVICGPTGAGKSALAMALAERHRIAIVSADSRQVYRAFDVGTAKPSPADRAAVPHFGLDVAEPVERYSAATWADAAVGWIAAAEGAGRVPVIVGGTGLYLRALFAPLFDAPALDPARRAALAAVLEPMSVAELRRWCEALDPARAGLGRTQLLRAVETALLTGERLSELQGTRARAPVFSAHYLLVDPGPPLAEWLRRRTTGMLAAGWLEEVRALDARVPPEAPAWNATGYGVLRAHLHGALPLREAVERVTIETRQYAKRQRTWFRHQLPAARVTRVDPADPRREAIVARWWAGEEGSEA